MTPAALQALLVEGGEVAVIDPREEGAYSVSPHLFHAVNLPLSRLELRIRALVPRRETPVIVACTNEGPAAPLGPRTVARLQALGYEAARPLEGGVEAWAAAGLPLFTGFNTASKAFGEFIETECHTPSISADELQALKAAGADLVIVDSRTAAEHRRGTIPGSTSVPGAELVLRAADFAPSPDTLIVVNCAGRTRSIVGAQSLIHAGVPNRVVALRNGTMGWKLAGLEIETGSARGLPALGAAGLERARAAADRVAARFALPTVSWSMLQRWRADVQRSCHLFDVRTPDEYWQGHPRGAVHAEGGQLVQATDTWIAVRAARIVLHDPLRVRAVMTASWLRMMGYAAVSLLDGDDPEIVGGAGPAAPEIAGRPHGDLPSIEPDALQGLGARAAIVDLAPSGEYAAAHVPGAWWAVRARIAECLREVPAAEFTVLTSTDGVLAELAWAEAAALRTGRTLVLHGGTAAWRASGAPLESGRTRLATEVDDTFIKPFEHPDQRSAMQTYLAWEVGLLQAVRGDPSIRFSRPPG